MNVKDKDGFNFGQMTFLDTGQEYQLPLHLLVTRLSKSPQMSLHLLKLNGSSLQDAS